MQTLAQLDCDPALTIRPEASLDAALDRLLDSEATELFVTDDDDRLLGVVPDYELLKSRLSGQWTGLAVGQLISNRLLRFTLDTPLSEALRAFREGQHSRAAILQDGRLIGLITRRSLLRALCQTQPASHLVAPPKFLPTFGLVQLSRSPA